VQFESDSETLNLNDDEMELDKREDDNLKLKYSILKVLKS
jgi:hypothetical protein